MTPSVSRGSREICCSLPRAVADSACIFNAHRSSTLAEASVANDSASSSMRDRASTLVTIIIIVLGSSLLAITWECRGCRERALGNEFSWRMVGVEGFLGSVLAVDFGTFFGGFRGWRWSRFEGFSGWKCGGFLGECVETFSF